MKTPSPKPSAAAEQGFMLVGLIVAIFLILLVLGVAAPRVARSLRRDREVEAVHRGKQYVRAIRQYYLKTGHYPGSLEQLEKTNNVRFLRQRYTDPLNSDPAKADWRLIHVGEAKTTVKGFFGQPLSGLPGASAGLGSLASSASSGPTGAGAAGMASGSSSTFGSSSSGSSTFGSSTFGSSGGSSTFGGGSTANSAAGANAGSGTNAAAGSQAGSSFGSVAGGTGLGSTNGTGSSSGSGSSNGLSSQSSTSFTGTGAPIMGVGSSAPGESIVVLNEQTSYPAWEFLYDPRIEQLKAKAAMLGGPASSSGTGTSSFETGTSSFGAGTNGAGTNGAGMNGTAAPGTPAAPAPPTTGVPGQP